MNDLISRSALLENYGLKNAVKYGNETSEQQHNSYSTLMLYEIADMINDAPAVDAEVVRHGKWDSEVVKCCDWKGIQRDYFQPHSCSLCHKPDPSQGKSNYCPNCGAKMDGEHDVVQRV